MKRFAIAGGVTVATAVAVFSLFQIYIHKPTTIQPNPTPIGVYTLLDAVNKERMKAGVPKLTIDKRLVASAQAKCDDENANNYYDHVSPTGIHGVQTAVNSLGGEGGNYNENLAAAGKGTPASVEPTVQSWLDSPIHRREMLSDKYTITGFGISGQYVCEHFYGSYK